MTPIVQLVLVRIRANWRNNSCGTWLLADPEGQVYALSEHSATPAELGDRWGWVAGMYGRRVMEPGGKPRWPTLAEIRDALIQAFIDNGFVTEQMIYDEIRGIEG